MAAARNQVDVMRFLITTGADWRVRSKVWLAAFVSFVSRFY